MVSRWHDSLGKVEGRETMNRTQLGQNLIRYRFIRNGVNLGMSPGEAALMAEQRMKNDGLFGLLAKLKVMGTPEGAIIIMVEAYLRALIQKIEQRPDIINRPDGDLEKSNWNEQCRKYAAECVEQFRQKIYPGQSYYPCDLHSYVAYRIGIEMMALHQMDASEMGLDQEAIFYMVEEARRHFHGNLD